MKCTFSELKNREVINIVTGTRIGYIDDLRLNADKCRVDAFIIYGRPRFFGLLGRDEDIIVDSDEIVMIGTDTVLVKADNDNLSKITKEKGINLFE
ncbi:MAG: YlmC/YmxH family sporulation protein [Huintestinicola sp.]